MACKTKEELFKTLRKSFPKEVPDNILKDVAQSAFDVKKTSRDLTEFKENMKDFREDQRQLLAIEEVEKAGNLAKINKAIDFAMSEQNIHEMMKTYMVGSPGGLIEGGDFSIDRQTRVLRGTWTKQLIGGLEQKELWKIFTDGQLSQEIMQEMFELRPGGNPGISRSPQALEIARTLRGIQNSMVERLRLAGVPVGFIPGYIFRQAHDQVTVNAAGFVKWNNDIMPRLDHKKTFGNKSPEEVNEFMTGVWKDIVYGKSDDTGGKVADELVTVNKRSVLGKNLSQSRKIHFNNGKDFFEYNKLYGHKDILNSIVASIDHNARSVSVIEKFGTDPQSNYEGIKKRIKARLSKEGRHKERETFEMKETALDKRFREVSGNFALSSRNTFARISKGLRTMTNMTKLGAAGVHSITDWSTAASMLQSSLGMNVFEAQAGLMREFFKNIKPSERRLAAQKFGLLIDDYIGELYARLDVGEGLFGRGIGDKIESGLFHAQRLYFRLNLLHQQTSAAKAATVNMFATELHNMSGNKFSGLTDRVRANLGRYNISEFDWDMIRVSKEQLGDRGFLTVEALDNLPDEFVKELAKNHRIKKPNIKRLRIDASEKYQAYLTDHAELGSPTPGARQRVTLLQGTDAGTPEGEAARFWAQFKHFPTTMIEVGRRTALSDPNKSAKTMREAFKSGGKNADIQNFASFIVNTTLLGYTAGMLRDAFRGRTPKDPRKVATWTDAAIRGGAGGLYVDFLFQDYTQYGRSSLKFLAGPVVSQLDDVLLIKSRIENGQKVASQALRFAKSNTPAYNLFYLQHILDNAIVSEWQERLNPGAMKRTQKQLDKNFGQKIVW